MPDNLTRCPFAQFFDGQNAGTPAHLDDFRNLFGQAKPEDQYQGFGVGQEDKTREMLLYLEACMVGLDRNRREDGGSGIPAGYTYLGQLVAHDLVQNETSLPRHRSSGRSRVNLRHRRLMLETIYGGGPGAIPYAYENETDKSGGNRTRLRLHRLEADGGNNRDLGLGQVEAEGNESTTDLTKDRDLPRASVYGLSGNVPASGHLVDALIADPRNDDHLIIAQLTVIFHLLHNWIDGRLRETHEGNGTDEVSAAKRFQRARKLTTYLYRRVIFEDLLPRLLDPRIYQFYQFGRGRMERTGDHRIPLEFSHAAFRAGHAMVRGNYNLQYSGEAEVATLDELFDRTSTQATDMVPHSKVWWVQWSNFYKINNFRDPQESNPLSPAIVRRLADEDAFLVDGRGSGGLIFRDFLRGAFSAVRSVDSLTGIVSSILPPEIVAGAALLDKQARYESLTSWLKANRKGYLDDPVLGHPIEMNDEQIENLANDPPLLFFILVEAMEDHAARKRSGGDAREQGFGILGSVIVAETFYRSRDHSQSLIEDDEDTQFLAAELFSAVVPRTMPDLIEALANKLGLSDPEHKFL